MRSVLREEWGLAEDALVSAGSGDNMMSAIGTGNIRARRGHDQPRHLGHDLRILRGTGNRLERRSRRFLRRTDHWLPLACTMNVAVATEQMRELFGWDIPTMEARVAAAPAGAGGILFLPYLQGERTPNLPNGSGVFHGLTSENMTPEFMARAVLEGVTLGLAYSLRRFKELGIVPEEIRLTGGGSKSPVWRQIAADVLGLPTVALHVTEGAALGAAIQAAWTYGQVKGKPLTLEKLVDDIVVVDKKTRVEPNKESRSLYRELLLRQIDLTKKLKTAGYL